MSRIRLVGLALVGVVLVCGVMPVVGASSSDIGVKSVKQLTTS
jgi:hypothetical protein